jgi:hypothetical protein
MLMHRRLGAFVCLIALLVVREARADVVEPPRFECPEGSRGVPAHGLGWCEPLICVDDHDCEMTYVKPGQGQWICRERPLCIETTMVRPRSRGRPPSGPASARHVALGACGQGRTCTGSARCEVKRRCVFVESAPTDTPDQPAPDAPTSTAPSTATAPPPASPPTNGEKRAVGVALAISAAVAASAVIALVVRRRSRREIDRGA